MIRNLIILHFLSHILAVPTTQANSYNFEEIMSVPLHKCAVILYDLEAIEFEGGGLSKSDHVLVEQTINSLVNIQVPFQFWVCRSRRRSATGGLNVDPSLIYEGLDRNGKLTCITSLWFLKQRISSMHKTQTITPLPWLLFQVKYRRERTESDYAILGFADIPGYVQKVDLSNPLRSDTRLANALFIPDNLILARMRLDDSFEDKTFHVHSVGGLRYFCPSNRYFCIDWYKASDTGIEFWKTSEEFHERVGQLSSYLGGRFYNFNKAPVQIIHMEGMEHKYWDMVRRLDYRKGLFLPYSYDKETNRKVYGLHNLAQIQEMRHYVEIIERTFNATVWEAADQKQSYLLGQISRFPAVLMYVQRPGPPSLDERIIYDGFTHLSFHCLDFQNVNVQFHVLFHPMDTWTWAFLVSAGGALALTFRKHLKNPVFNLIILFFAQGDGEKVKKFEFLLVLWSCLGLLLTAGYSSFISSLLIVPQNTEYPGNFKEIYEQGYKLWSTAKSYRLAQYFRRDVLKDPDFIAKNQHLIKLDEETVIHSPVPKAKRQLLPDLIEKYGKYCQLFAERFHAQANCEAYLNVYDGLLCFTDKESLSINPHLYIFDRTGAEVFRRGVQVLIGTGIIEWWKIYHQFGDRMELERSESVANKLRESEYRYGYFFKIPRDENLYLFTLRNAQGRMIFYFGVICAGISVGGLLLERILGVWQRCYQKTKKGLESSLKYLFNSNGIFS